MLERAKVSIIMPAYNAGQYITEAIQSVLTQTHKNLELLIINDGSTDDTEEKILAFDNQRIHYFKQTNKGVSAARNVGLAHMQGDYFCFLDADDVMPSKSLESRLNIFVKDEELSFVDGCVSVMDTVLQKTVRVFKPSFRGYPLPALLKLSDQCFLGNTWMIKHDRNRTYRFKEGLTHGEDLLFYLSIAQDGMYYATDQIVLCYRTGNGSAMSNLQGLEKGYQTIYQELQNSYSLNSDQLLHFKQSIRSIVFKSYLGHRQPWQAVQSLYRMSVL